MKKNDRFFSAGLYREGLRQSRMIGIASLCCAALLLLFDVFKLADESMDVITWWASVVSGGLGVYIVAPVVMLMLFRFLGSRAASDFYHSLPGKRSALALSFSAAAATWALAPAVPGILAYIIAMPLTGRAIDWANLGGYAAGTAAAVVYAIGVALLAVSVVNGVFGQIVAMILGTIMPALLINTFSNAVCEGAPVLIDAREYLGVFADCRNLLLHDLTRGSFSEILYTFVLGLAVFAAGVFCFCRRKSEKATLPAVSRWVQGAVRCLLMLLLCLAPCAGIAEALVGGTKPNIISLVLWYGFALIAYFLYEAISTRSIRSLFKLSGDMLLGLAVVAVFNLAFVFGTAGLVQRTLSEEIEPAEVVNVQSLVRAEIEPSFGLVNVSKVKFSDEKVIELLCETYNTNIQLLHGSSSISDKSRLTVAFTLKDGRTLRRNLFLNEWRRDEISEYMKNSEEYREALRIMPPENEIIVYECVAPLTQAQLRELFGILIGELGELSDDEYYAYLSTCGGNSEGAYPAPSAELFESMGQSLDYIGVNGRTGLTYWSEQYTICGYTPKTAARYVEMQRETVTVDLKTMFDRVCGGIEAEDYSHMSVLPYYSAEMAQKVDGRIYDIYLDQWSGTDPGEYTALVNMLSKNTDKPLDLTGSFVEIELVNENGNGTPECFTYYAPIDDTVLAELERIYGVGGTQFPR